MILSNTQRIKLWSIAALILVVSCARTTQPDPAGPIAKEDEKTVPVKTDPEPIAVAEESTATPAEDLTVDPIVEQWSDSLQKHFSASERLLLNHTVSKYKGITSATDLAYFYQVLLRDTIQPLVERQFRAGCPHADYGSFADDDWDWIGEVLPYIGTKVTCHHLNDVSVSCAHIAPISLLPLRDAAANTPQLEDDLFFDALIAIHTGTDPGQMVGFEVFDGQDNYHTRQNVGCDSCTIGMLGDGHRSEIISKLAQAARSRKLFNKAFTTDLNHLLGGLQQEHYHYSKAAVLHELDDIIITGSTSRLLTKNEIAALQETQMWVQAKQTGFECVTADCQNGSASFE